MLEHIFNMFTEELRISILINESIIIYKFHISKVMQLSRQKIPYSFSNQAWLIKGAGRYMFSI